MKVLKKLKKSLKKSQLFILCSDSSILCIKLTPLKFPSIFSSYGAFPCSDANISMDEIFNKNFFIKKCFKKLVKKCFMKVLKKLKKSLKKSQLFILCSDSSI